MQAAAAKKNKNIKRYIVQRKIGSKGSYIRIDKISWEDLPEMEDENLEEDVRVKE